MTCCTFAYLQILLGGWLIRSYFNVNTVAFKDTHREKTPSNKTPALRKSTNMGVWTVGRLNQLFIRGS